MHGRRAPTTTTWWSPRTRAGGQEYVVSVAVSLEEVDDSTAALVPLLLVGLPLVLLVVGGTTWMVATRALAPVERIRREVEQITGQRLDRRVPEPTSRDEIHRLALTMNRMLGRLETSRDRQQQFVADASHELRSPLASIRQTAEVARAHPGALPEGELAEAVLEESVRMQRLVEQLLLLTRADEGVVVRYPARRRPRRPGAHRGPTRGPIRPDGGHLARSQAGRVRGDETSLGAGGAQPRRQRRPARPGPDRPQRRTSRGRGRAGRRGRRPGRTRGRAERVFERFVRLDEARARDAGGSGLGLAIVAEIVHAHGGSVAVVDLAGLGGARFVVRLPPGLDPS